jgi:undecaprenyl-diphosphatase
VTTTPVGEHAPTHGVRDWGRKLITFWTLIAIVSAIAIGVFADLGEDVAEKSTTTFDNAVRAWVISHQNPVVYKLAYFVTWTGSPIVMVFIAIAAGVWFYGREGRSKAGVMVAAPAVGGLLSAGVKLLYGRMRPAGGALLNETTYSFPSGHATTSAAVVVTLCYVMAREGMISWTTAIIVGALIPLLVGLSRVYLDVHWTTDVVGGWTVGLFVAAVSAALYEYLRRSAPPAVETGAAGVRT